ncbi:uncharacterized protein LOC126248929 [Schistocerca nitens]|uniref:uncharacterized protein LOC126248929 n=1 Tax=Schistocerca nitens TaxID=7011 RepID=UPI002118923F|nr:uncharacterized protein LOC126248929 [Schistocerca nitens]
MEVTGGDDMEDDETFTSPFPNNEISKEERQLKANTIFQREFDKQLDELEKQIIRHECSITLVKKYLNIIRCQLLLRGVGDDKFLFGAGAYHFINTRKRAEKQNVKNKSISTGIQPEQIPCIKDDSSCGNNNNRVLETEVKSALTKNNNRIARELHQKSECHIRGRRFKKLQRFVVGNVSQWCPERQYQVSAPYKWMLYIRGPREDPEISKYVTKVSVFLDPSYYPNNVVHMIEPPFHLVRRGWGEFLVRIVIFFYLSRNKPLTIYHRLQLDRTQCGYQRGAPETIADYWIYTDIPRNSVNLDSVVQLGYKKENVTIKEDRDDGNKLKESSSKEIDHHFIKDSVSNVNLRQTKRMSVTEVLRLVGGIVTEHNYSSLYNPEKIIRSKPSQQVPLVNPFQILIEGKSGVSVLKTSAKRSASGGPPKKRRMLTKSSSEIEYDKLFRLAAEKGKTLPWHQAVSFLLHRLPLVTDKAASQEYSRFHPYAAKSVDQYHSWSMARQCAAQYYRSKMIKNALFGCDSSEKSWTCKEIVIYARRHGYVPYPKIKLVQDGCEKKYVKISASDSMCYKLSRKQKSFPRSSAEKDASAVINNKPERGCKVKKNKMSLDKNKGDTTTDTKNIAVTEITKKETTSVNKDYTPLIRPKSNPALEFKTNENKIFKANAKKINKSKKKRSETQINKDNLLQNLRRLCMKPTLCEPKRVLEFIYANDEDDDGWNDDPRDVDILSVYNKADGGDSLSEDILEVDNDRAQLCHFVRKSLKWLSLWNGPKPNHYTIPEVLVAIAAELFMEDIFRRTLDVAWNHYDPKGKTPVTIYLRDALVALRRRKQFDIFSNCGLGVDDTRQVDK